MVGHPKGGFNMNNEREGDRTTRTTKANRLEAQPLNLRISLLPDLIVHRRLLNAN
jgi:hypothetical protein